MPKRARDPIDDTIATQLRLARLGEGLSQASLGKHVGVRELQVHRYETGQSRIGAARLYRVAHALDLPIEYFFYGLPVSPAAEEGRPEEAGVPNLTGQVWKRRLEKHFAVVSRILDPDVQLALHRLQEALRRFYEKRP